MSKIVPVSLLVLLPFYALFAQFDSLKVMYYNTLNYPDAGDPDRELDFRTIHSWLQADIILINELTSEQGANILLNDALNVYGTTKYQRASFTDGPDTENMLFYNSDKLTLYSQWYIPTLLRHINEYVLYYNSSDLANSADTIFFYFYSAHLKAYPEDSLQRLAEVNDFQARLNSISDAENIFFGGDLNLYTNLEPAYQSLISEGTYTLYDPLPAGEWHANYSFRYLHTQSTRTASFGGGSTGGLDDRFDLILFSDDVNTGSNGVQYINNSCVAFGNDGNHFNDALIDTPLNPNIPDSVTYALYNMSDHLPVVCVLLVEANPDTTSSNLVITEIMYNPPEAGLDSLEFIEIYNNSNIPENLAGYSFQSGIDFVFPDMTIDPGEFIVVAINATAMMNTFNSVALQWTGGGLNNSGELILLKDNSGNTIDSVWYSDSSPWPADPDGNGPSLFLCNPASDNAVAGNWAVSSTFVTNNGDGNPIYASPGFSECGLPPVSDFTANTVMIYPGEQVNFTDLSLNNPDSWSWSFEAGSPAISTSQNPVVTYNNPGTYDVQLSVSNAYGNSLELKTDYITVIDDSPVLVVSEIMQNPSEVNDSEGEWFEVFNPTNSVIDMLGWKIADNDNDYHVISSSVLVPAHGFAVLGSNDDSGINGEYTCNYQYVDFFLANGADEIVLIAPDDTEVDRLEYDGGPNWPDPNGSSMVFTGTADMDNSDFNQWTVSSLREPSFIGTIGDNGSPGMNGTPQNLVSPSFELQLTVYLEGALEGSLMGTTLPGLADFPLNQPYSAAPWFYNGSETISSIPNPDVVDWVLVELRDATDVSSAVTSTVIAQKACLLLKDGRIVGTDGSSKPGFTVAINNQLFVVVRHRNCLPVISAIPLVDAGGVYSYDFSMGPTQAYNSGQKEIAPGIWGMMSGDCNASGSVDVTDKSIYWNSDAGVRGYLNTDLNFDSEVNNLDKNDLWFPNIGAGSQVPD